MSNNSLIQRFEHDSLPIGTEGFEKRHWEALAQYNENYGGRFFSLTHNGVKFKQYVGVIQVEKLIIEILPKISQKVPNTDKSKWQRVLIDMLRECQWMKLYSHEKASLRFKPNSILEAYLELFISEYEILLREGLVKKYRPVTDNNYALKGKLIFNKQIQLNIVHQERFFTKHQLYDRNNIYNQILLKALKIIPSISQKPIIQDKVYSLLLSFPDLDEINVDAQTFDTLIYNRKYLRYKEALQIAAMLLLNFKPDIITGKNHVLALLFDMNDLWEEYVYRQLLKNKIDKWKILYQNSKPFWKLTSRNSYKIVKPDLFINIEEDGKRIIIDTKWKLPENDIPSDSDLKQIYVYNHYWHGKYGILLYPSDIYCETPIYYPGTYLLPEDNELGCSVMKVSILDNNSRLDSTLGKRINKYLSNQILSSCQQQLVEMETL